MTSRSCESSGRYTTKASTRTQLATARALFAGPREARCRSIGKEADDPVGNRRRGTQRVHRRLRPRRVRTNWTSRRSRTNANAPSETLARIGSTCAFLLAVANGTVAGVGAMLLPMGTTGATVVDGAVVPVASALVMPGAQPRRTAAASNVTIDRNRRLAVPDRRRASCDRIGRRLPGRERDSFTRPTAATHRPTAATHRPALPVHCAATACCATVPLCHSVQDAGIRWRYSGRAYGPSVVPNQCHSVQDAGIRWRPPRETVHR